MRIKPLRRFLEEHALGGGRLEVEPLGDGHSNITLAVRTEDSEVVLRRPPRGPLPPSAHDVIREARLIQALAGTGVRVPRVLATCPDPALIGAPFYVMERLHGHVVHRDLPDALCRADDRRRMSEEFVDALVELHAVDWRSTDLAAFGKPTGYLERQVRRFAQLWVHNCTRDVPAFDGVTDWLRRNLPETPVTTVVHGDYRLGNVMFAPSAPPRLEAVFDWEMATIGDPLADVGYMSALWAEDGDPPLAMLELSRTTRLPGFLTRAGLVARYEEQARRPVTDLRWYQVLALWKSAVFMEGNYKRSLDGTSDDPFHRAFGAGVVELVDRARALAAGG
ncbi:MAG: hypothetical protein QOI64_378 [Solirubrobacteraceae bacterium]|nr:hypothetical protein [Solirubrobacteraceae bacterium]